jgi:hypothetical protein
MDTLLLIIAAATLFGLLAVGFGADTLDGHDAAATTVLR